LNALPVLIENCKMIGWGGKISTVENVEKLSPKLRVEAF
jgi:hypothetical protein